MFWLEAFKHQHLGDHWGSGFPQEFGSCFPFLFNMVAGEKGVPGIPLSYKFGSSRDEGCSMMGRTMMESKCYYVCRQAEARAAHPTVGNGAFPWEGVGGKQGLSTWLLHSGELRDAS